MKKAFDPSRPVRTRDGRERIKREWWVNVYPKDSGIRDQFHYDKKDAARASASCRIACVPITIDCEEGEGL